MKNIENIMTMKEINKLEEIEIPKEAASQNILNDVINMQERSTLQNITLS